jgi:hypothetical protein
MSIQYISSTSGFFLHFPILAPWSYAKTLFPTYVGFPIDTKQKRIFCKEQSNAHVSDVCICEWFFDINILKQFMLYLPIGHPR